MPTFTMTKSYDDGLVLTEAMLDDMKSSTETFLNTTKIDTDNIQALGIATANLANNCVTGAKIANLGVDSAQLAAGSVTGVKLNANVVDETYTTLTANQITFKSTALDEVRCDQSYELENLSLACTVGSSALTIALKQKSGSDAASTETGTIHIGFRNVTTATGTYLRRTVTGALSVVVSSGSTLGTLSGINAYLYVYAIDNAGTVELAVSHTYYDEGSVRTTVAEGGAGAADSNSTIYSTSARTSVPVRCIGRLLVNEATAGTWASAPTEISLWPFIPQRVTAIYETNSTNGASNATATTVDFEDRIVDTHGAVTTGTWLFTAPKAAIYHVAATIQLASIATWTATKKVVLTLQKNAADHRQFASFTSEGTTTMSIQLGGTCLVSLAAGDTLRMQWTQDTGNGVNLDSNAAHNYISISEQSYV